MYALVMILAAIQVLGILVASLVWIKSLYPVTDQERFLHKWSGRYLCLVACVLAGEIALTYAV